MRVQPDDPEYLERAGAEAEFWQRDPMHSLESLDAVLADSPIERYTNRRFTGEPGVAWEQMIARYGDFRRGLALGTSIPALEARVLKGSPGMHLTLIDLCERALERHRSVLDGRFPGRVAIRIEDLNFIELEKNAYDFVMSCGTIHHIINLEYLAYQINGALTDDGYFFLQDFVAEPRCRFSEEKRRSYEAIVARQMKREDRKPGLVWEAEDSLSPFCGVRSDETLEVFRRVLREERLATAGALFGPMMRSKCAAPARLWQPKRIASLMRGRIRRLMGARIERMIDERFIEDLARESDALEDAGVLLPNIAFAIYRKRRDESQAHE